MQMDQQCCKGDVLKRHKGPEMMRTSLSLDPRDDDPSTLLRLLAGAGRFDQLDGPVELRGVVLCRFDESNADGGPLCSGV